MKWNECHHKIGTFFMKAKKIHTKLHMIINEKSNFLSLMPDFVLDKKEGEMWHIKRS